MFKKKKKDFMGPDFQTQLFQDRTEYQSLVLFIPSRGVTLHLGPEGIHTLGIPVSRSACLCPCEKCPKTGRVCFYFLTLLDFICTTLSLLLLIYSCMYPFICLFVCFTTHVECLWQALDQTENKMTKFFPIIK